MLKSLVSGLKKQFSNDEPPEEHVRSIALMDMIDVPLHLLGPDKEEEGFVVVGETSVERTTVGPQLSGVYPDLPPSYESQVQTPPAYGSSDASLLACGIDSMTVSTSKRNSLSSPSSSAANQTLNSVTSPTTNSQNTGMRRLQSCTSIIGDPLADGMDSVPFQLSPILASQAQPSGLVVAIRRPNLDSYNYDFSLERSVLDS